MSRRSSAIERVICAMPSCSPRVQTLVATKAWRCIGGVSRSPSTASAVEYIGEVSRTVAPAAKNAPSTTDNGARAPASGPTSKGPDVPRPMTGRASPLDGMRRVSSAPAATPPPAAVEDGTPGASSTAAVAAPDCMN